MRFQVIVCDPPWAFSDGLKRMKAKTKRSAASQYPVMSPASIARLDVPSLIDPAGCVLALWVPGSMIVSGIDVAWAWGFTVKQTYVWGKTKRSRRKTPLTDPNDCLGFGMGRLFRQCHETALICTAGKSVYPMLRDRSQRSVTMYPNFRHSQKPPGLHVSLERMFPDAARLELFARRPVAGWTCLGNAIDGRDIAASIHDLTNVVGSSVP